MNNSCEIALNPLFENSVWHNMKITSHATMQINNGVVWT